MILCAYTLLALLASATVHNTDDNEIRLAIDLDAAQMHAGEYFEVKNANEATREELVKLVNKHELMSAEEINGTVVVKKRWGR